jgi:predicted  nucleic acid-binding Zn-ribbon protein
MANIKTALKAYKELQDQQKSDLEKTKEEKDLVAQENATLKAQLKAIETERTLNKVLTEMQIDGNYHKALMKLIPEVPEDEKELKDLITSTIKEFLPGAIEQKDVGFEKKPDKKPDGGSKQYLNEKYKNNPFYKG